MNNTIKYKGFSGSVDVDEDGQGFSGKILNIDDELSLYCGRTYEEFIQFFHEAVDDYIERKRSKAEEKNKQYKGSFNARVKNDVHRDAVVYSMKQRTSLNNLIEEAIKDKIYSN